MTSFASPRETASRPLDLVFIGLTLSSSWGNGHATTYRGLLRALHERGHRIRFFEQDVPWYAQQRDLRKVDYCELNFYRDPDELRERHADAIASCDAVIIGSYVQQSEKVIAWVADIANSPLAFYDIDTPVTLDGLRQGNSSYLQAELVPLFDLYLSFSGGRALAELEERFGARRARHLPCAVDPELYRPASDHKRYLLGYLGTYSDDRQPGLDRLLTEPALSLPQERFAVAGPQYPDSIQWPQNVQRVDHLPPREHPTFYAQQRFTLNITRDAMKRLGHSPSVRLFEAASCATAIISDPWAGIEDYFQPGREIFLCDSTPEMISLLRDTPPENAREMAHAARERVQREHTPRHRALALESFLAEAGAQGSGSSEAAVRNAVS